MKFTMGQSLHRFRRPLLAILMTLNILITYELWIRNLGKFSHHSDPTNPQLETELHETARNSVPKNSSNGNYRQNLEIPALVILGPAKTGTRSFIDAIASFDDVIQYESERHFWAGSAKYVCRPWYTKSEWEWFIDRFVTKEINLTYMVNNISTHSDNHRCNIQRYKGQWLKKSTMKKLMDKYFNENAIDKKNCIHPRYYVDHQDDNNENVKYCYLIEKGPSYLNSPWVAAIYSSLLPKIKVIGLIRNPINHVWSNYWAFGQIYDESQQDFESNIAKIEKHILDKFMHSFSFNELREFCVKMNNKSDMINYNYMNFMGLYLRLRFIEPMDILPGLRDDGFIWFPLQIIHLLFWLNTYDQNGIINNFKLIQSEYFFENTDKAINEIRCWLSNGYQCDGFDVNINSMGMTLKNHANYNKRPSRNFVHSMLELLDPFTVALYNLLNDRKDILIGTMTEWSYSQ